MDAGELGDGRDCPRAGVRTGDRTIPRSFNRFELKYVADVWQARRFHDDIHSLLAPNGSASRGVRGRARSARSCPCSIPLRNSVSAKSGNESPVA